jgi:hypothetical protein
VDHILTDLTFFIFVWPYDTQRRLIWDTGVSDIWFWIHAAQAILFTVLASLAFRRLVRVTKAVQSVADASDRELGSFAQPSTD